MAAASTAKPTTEPAAAQAIRSHWPEYLMEALGLGLFMVSACAFGTLLEHPSSPVRLAIPNADGRRTLMGLAMGVTAVALIYSPWGKRSGAHMNPALTLAMTRLGHVQRWDAVFYVGAQFAGGLAGVALMAKLLGPLLADPAVNYIVTRPGPAGLGPALAAELAMSFGLMSLVIVCTTRARLLPWTGVLAGSLVALWIAIEAPISGMSMNPARSFATAAVARHWTALWVYFLAPPLGMLLAVEASRFFKSSRSGCAKLHHPADVRCIFCGQPGSSRATGTIPALPALKPSNPGS